jgi:Carboxypeptidase regulatory-like domain
MKPLLLLTLLFAVCLLQPGCKKIDDTPADNGGGGVAATINGRVVAANNRTPVSRALVFIDKAGAFFYTYTSSTGQFSLNAPAGQHQLHIQTGDGSMFHTTINVTVTAGETLQLPAAGVKLEQVAKLAYVTGTYDRIERLLTDSLGYAATALHHTALGQMNILKDYDAVYLNCSEQSSQPANPLYDQAMATYVANGGSLYVSDWAVRQLIGTTVTMPCPAVRPGGFLPDSLLCVRQTGPQAVFSNSPVVSASLSAYLNKSSIDIIYDLSSWEEVKTANLNFWEVMVKDVAGNPLLLRTHQYTNPSAGTVQIGNAGDGRVTVCHKVNGGNPVTITIPAAALPAHLAHGDTVGECGNPDGSGRIYFTTFHNEPNGAISRDVQHILQYMILNL